jgi:hypothetical protein
LVQFFHKTPTTFEAASRSASDTALNPAQ